MPEQGAKDMPEVPAVEPEQEPAAVKPTPPEMATLPLAELNALRRVAAESSKAARHAKDLAGGAQRERDAVAAENRQMARERRVGNIARAMKFRDPADVLARVTAEESETDAGVEAALARIAEASPHLVATPATVPVIGQVLAPAAVEAANAPDPGYTAQQLRDMKASDFARMGRAEFAEVQRALRTLGPPAA
jgi:hypothetical protein